MTGWLICSLLLLSSLMGLPKIMKKKKDKEKEIMNIPNDVIMEIFSRLPANLLLRFRWVCKSWFNLISDPSFVSMQVNYNINHKLNNNPLVLICSYNNTENLKLNSYNIVDTNDYDHALLCPNSLVSVLKVPSATSLHYPIEILGSCNGLLCIMGVRYSTSICEKYFICNPCTKEYKKVDHVDMVMANNNGTNSVGSDEYGLGRRYGFGYDCTIGDYKLVKTAIRVLDNGKHETCIYVYTLGTSSWKTTRSSYQFILYSTGTPEADDANNGVVLSGHFYFTAKGNSPKRFDIIVSFDFAKEEYRQIPIPVICEDGPVLKLEELKGCLCLLSCCTVFDLLGVWIMRHNVESNIDVKEEYTWKRLCTIKSANVRWNSLRTKTPKLLRICKNGEILMVTVDANNYRKEIVLYDPKSGKTTSLREIQSLENVVNYMESLVLSCGAGYQRRIVVKLDSNDGYSIQISRAALAKV